MTSPELAWYVARLAEIPILEDAAGLAECRRIGNEIHRRYDRQGMQEVCQAYRNSLDAETAAKIARAWTGIGGWQG